MSLAYGFVFAVLAALAALMAVLASGWSLLPLRIASAATAFSLLIVAIAYFGAGPRLLGKRRTGRRHPLAWVAHWPFFTLTWVSYRISLLLSRESAYVQVAPNIFLGRRLRVSEAKSAGAEGWVAVLDLVAEMPEPRLLRERPNYRLLPVLDATALTPSQLRDAVEWLKKHAEGGPVYVHCALGHGRSALVVAAYLVARGLVPEAKAAIKLIRALRPGVRLNRPQRKLLEAFAEAVAGSQLPINEP